MTMNKRFPDSIAILGATGHIAKNLIYYMASRYHLVLFARSFGRLNHFLLDNELHDKVECMNYKDLNLREYKVIINCTGIGDPQILKSEPCKIFQVTEEIDNLVLNYLVQHRDTLYINTSSGAAYCNDFVAPSTSDSSSSIKVNHLGSSDYYGICKLYSESKHRSLSEFNIVDLRIFSFFSRFIDHNSIFFINDIIKCVKGKRTFETNDVDIIRDYIHPHDFVNLIDILINELNINESIDVYSKFPIKKFEIIRYFQEHYGLTLEIIPNHTKVSVTGMKPYYYSCNYQAQSLGYSPVFSSLDTIINESKYLF